MPKTLTRIEATKYDVKACGPVCHPFFEWPSSCANTCHHGRMTKNGKHVAGGLDDQPRDGSPGSSRLNQIMISSLRDVNAYQSIMSDVAVACKTLGLSARELAQSQATPDSTRHHTMPKLAPARHERQRGLSRNRTQSSKIRGVWGNGLGNITRLHPSQAVPPQQLQT